jgi:hypothetical protein
LVGKAEEKRPLGRSRCTREDNIKINLRKIKFEVFTGFIWLKIRTYGRLFVNMVINLRVPLKGREFLDYLSVVSASHKGLCPMLFGVC